MVERIDQGIRDQASGSEGEALFHPLRELRKPDDGTLRRPESARYRPSAFAQFRELCQPEVAGADRRPAEEQRHPGQMVEAAKRNDLGWQDLWRTAASLRESALLQREATAGRRRQGADDSGGMARRDGPDDQSRQGTIRARDNDS